MKSVVWAYMPVKRNQSTMTKLQRAWHFFVAHCMHAREPNDWRAQHPQYTLKHYIVDVPSPEEEGVSIGSGMLLCKR